MAVWPGANTTFTVQRSVVTATPGTNPTRGVQAIATGVSLAIQDLQGTIQDAKGGLIFNAEFKASTYRDAPIQRGDILLDENDTDPDGTPCSYEVQGRTIGALGMVLHLRRTAT